MTEIINNAAIRGVGNLVWRYAEPLYYKDRHGKLWVIPEGFAFDKRSTPFFLWPFAPPSIGYGDHVWGIHDFERRCYKLLGLRLRDVDGYRFMDAMEAVGKSRTRRFLHSAAVQVGAYFGNPQGIGEHPDSRYNCQVFSDEKQCFMPLQAWALEHYAPDGGGLI